MIVGFNARALAAPQIRGWTRYTLQLLRHLPACGAELVLFSDQPLNPEYLAQLTPGSFRVVYSPKMRYVAWEQVWLPVACARNRVEVLHAPANYGLPLVCSCPKVLTLHDAIDVAFDAPRGPVGLRQRLVQASFWIARSSADRIITVSAHAKSDLVRHLSIPAPKITVIHEASDLQERSVSPTDEQRLFESLGIDRPFVLYAGGFERRKNVDFLVDAFRSASLDGVSLVLVGSNPPARLAETARGSLPNTVRLMGFLPDATLSALYRRALAFVYPSLYEGFGLQLCEAMAFGCPTLASNTTSLPEVLGGGGATFSPTDPESLISELRRVSHEPVYHKDLAARAASRARDFSWERTAQATYDVYRASLTSA